MSVQDLLLLLFLIFAIGTFYTVLIMAVTSLLEYLIGRIRRK